MKTKITFVLVVLVTAIVLSSAESAKADTWTQKADMPTARYGSSTCVVDGKIYAIGGVGGLKKVEEYNPATDTWTKKADMPTGRTFLASSTVDGKIYAIGGYTSHAANSTKLAAVEEYDPATNTWTKKADMPGPRGGLGTSVVNGRIYAVGGSGSAGYIATVWEYDPATDTWTTKADMPTLRNIAPTSLVNGKIYAFGGHTVNALPANSTVEEYDPVADTWTKKGDMPAPRAFGAASVVDEKIYLFGGYTGKTTNPVSTLFQYEPATDTWIAKDDMPVRMLGLSTSVVGGRIFVIGGTSASYPYNSGFLSTVWEYDPAPSPDFNGDGIVDCADICMMVEHWHTDEPLYDIAPPPFGDGIVDVQDLILLSEHLFEEIFPLELVAYWKFDETEGDVAYDIARGKDGFLFGEPVWQPAEGKRGGALEFDGIGDYVETDFVLNPADGAFSVFAWVKGAAPGQVIISQADGIGTGETWLGITASDGNLMTGLMPYQVGRTVIFPLESQSLITDGQWHHVGFIWDGSYRSLYVDGTEVAKDTNPITLAPLVFANGGMYIGAGKTLDAGTFFSGLIDDVRIYNVALSAEEIAALAQ